MVDARLAVILAKVVGDQADPFKVKFQLVMLGENVFTITVPEGDDTTAYYVNSLQISMDGGLPVTIPLSPLSSMAQFCANIDVGSAEDGSGEVGPDGAVPPGEQMH